MWSNWAGNQQTSGIPVSPANREELAQALAGNGPVRIAGSGHSFTPLIHDGARILKLDRMGEAHVIPADDGLAWVNANAQLKSLSPALQAKGLAFRNLGDINEQTLAGAAATATHGTGEGLQCLSAEISAVRLMTPEGELIDTDTADIDGLLPAAQVSLGLLGAVLEARLRVLPRYRLRRQVQVAPLEDTLRDMGALWRDNRNFEFYLLPFTGKTLHIRHNLSEAPDGKPPIDLDMIGVKAMKLARDAGRLSGGLRRFLLSLLVMAQGEEDYVGESWKLLCSDRRIRFMEMEYHLPPETAGDVLREIEALLVSSHPEIYFPIEVRKTAGDSAFLSPFHGGPRVSVAVHTDTNQAWQGYFDDCERVFRAAGGRPHWGKMHSLSHDDLAALYPDFESFCALRRKLDPQNRLLSRSLARLFEPRAL